MNFTKFFNIFRKHAAAVVVDNCEQITIRGFMRCLFNRDFSPLVVSGKPTEKAIGEAWQKIFEEYCRLLENSHYDELRIHMDELIKMQAKLLVIRASVSVLAVKYSEQAVRDLRDVGYMVSFPQDDPEKYNAELERCIGLGKNLTVKIQVKVSEIEKLRKLPGNNDNAEQSFMDGIAIISKFQGFRININEVSMLEYCTMMRNYNTFVNRQRIRNEYKNTGA